MSKNNIHHEDSWWAKALYHGAIGSATAFNALIGRPKIYFESDKAKLKNLPGRLLIISNHTYWLDPANLSIVFRGHFVNSVAAKEVFESGREILMKGLRCIPLDRSTMDLNCIKECVRRLKDNQRVLIFPEGQLNLTDDILPFKPGAALIAMQAQSAVVPVYTSGVYTPFGGLKMIIGEPLQYEELFAGLSGAAAVEHATAVMQSCMQKLQGDLLSKLSEKDMEKRQKYRQKFIDKRNAKVAAQAQSNTHKGDKNDN